MQLGISSYTYVWAIGVPGYPGPPEPLTAFGLLEKAARLGVRVVQIADNLPLHQLSESELDRLFRKAKQLKIDIEVGTRGIEREHLLQYLDLARRFESPILRVVIDHETYSSDSASQSEQPSFEMIVESLTSVIAEFEQSGVKLAIENHDRFKATMLLDLLVQIGSDQVGICFDTANSIGCLEGPELVLQVIGQRLFNLHIKDFCVFRPPHNKGFVVEGRPAGQGQLDIAALLTQVEQLSADTNAILELWLPPQESLKASIQMEDRWANESIEFLRQLITD